MHWFGLVIVALLVVAIVVFVGSIFMHGYYGYGPIMNYSGYPYYGWFFWPFGFIIPLIFIFFFVRIVFWGFGGWGWKLRYWYGSGYGDAHEILRQRYARGEITKDQFDQMARDLEQH